MTTVQFRVKNLVLFINYGNKKQNACFPPNLPGISTPKYQKWCPKANNSTAPQNHRGKENDRFCLQYCIIACQNVSQSYPCVMPVTPRSSLRGLVLGFSLATGIFLSLLKGHITLCKVSGCFPFHFYLRDSCNEKNPKNEKYQRIIFISTKRHEAEPKSCIL